VGKTKVEGNRLECRFDPNNPVVKKILDKAKTQVQDKIMESRLEPDKDQVEGDC
jgi:hypothetical protein